MSSNTEDRRLRLTEAWNRKIEKCSARIIPPNPLHDRFKQSSDYDGGHISLEDRIEMLTPCADELKILADKYPASAEWYEEGE